MNFIKQYRITFAILIPVLVLVFLRSIGSFHFRTDARKQAEPTILNSNILAIGQTTNLPGTQLIINLDRENISPGGTNPTVTWIPAESVLSKENLKTIRTHEGPVLLFSAQPAISARIWMILSQMGCGNLYILTNDPGNEKPGNQQFSTEPQAL